MTTAALRRARGLHLLVYGDNVNKIFRKFSLTEKRFILFHGLWGASACLLCSIVSKLWLNRAACQGAHDERKRLNSWQTWNWEKELGWRGDRWYDLSPHFPLCPIALLSVEFNNEWVHPWDQSTHDPLTSPGHSPLYIATFRINLLAYKPWRICQT